MTRTVWTAAFVQAAACLAATQSGRFNVVLIVVDDLRCSLGCYGDSYVKTPNIDRLARRGIRFQNAYCQYPVCNPSRTSFLTGLRPDTTQIFSNNVPFRKKNPDVVTLPELFRTSGYTATGLGKIFHRGQTIEDIRADMDDERSWSSVQYFKPTADGRRGEGRNLTEGRLDWCRWLAAEGTDEDQPDGQIAAEAVRVIGEASAKPFFLAIGFHKPHDPFVAPKEYFEMYPLDSIPLAKTPDAPPGDPRPAIPGGAERNQAFAKFTDAERREFRRAYFACTTFMDAQVGKVLDALDSKKLWDKTVVIFMGDHGYHLGERGWWNKATLFELSTRAPLIVAAPGNKTAGVACTELVEFVDLYPTCIDLCGLKAPHRFEGASLTPLLAKPDRPWKSAAFTTVQRGNFFGRTIRTQRYRYTEWDDGREGVELYDRDHDPDELMNLADSPDAKLVREDLHRQLIEGWKGALPPP